MQRVSNLFSSTLSFYECDFLYQMCSMWSFPRWIYWTIPMVIVNTLSGVLRHNVSAMQHDIVLHMHFIHSIYFLCLGSNTLNVNSTVILMIHIQMVCLHHCTECNKLDLNQRDWTLKPIEFGPHVFFIFVLYLKKNLSRQWNFLFWICQFLVGEC